MVYLHFGMDFQCLSIFTLETQRFVKDLVRPQRKATQKRVYTPTFCLNFHNIIVPSQNHNYQDDDKHILHLTKVRKVS